MRHPRRLVLLPATVLLLGSAPLSAPAGAASCQDGTRFVGATVSEGTPRWYDTEAAGRTTVAVLGPDRDLRIDVTTEDCTTVCDDLVQCTVTYTGTLSVLVHGGGGSYLLVASTAGVPQLAPRPASCNLADVATVCADLTATGVAQEVAVHDPASVPASAPVYASVDVHRFVVAGPTGPVGLSVPCVTVTGAGNSTYPCGLAGGTYRGPFLVLVDEAADQPLGPPLARVRVCHARSTLTVSGLGVETAPAFTLC